MALIRLKKKAPSDWKALKLTSQFIEMDYSKNILVSGFGRTNVDTEGAYSVNDAEGILLRMTQVKPISSEIARELEDALAKEILQSEGRVLTETEKKQVENKADNEMLYVDQSHGTGLCSGDSGGPALMKNAEERFVVTGVASFVLGSKGTMCGYVAAHTSIFKYRVWLSESFQALKDSNSSKNSLFE